ncbi:MAG: FAD-dependent oxidoreductase [Fermentimonas sp.]
MLVGKYQLGNSALVIGGGMIGCETAEFALDYCEKVAIIEQLNLRAMIILSLQ